MHDSYVKFSAVHLGYGDVPQKLEGAEGATVKQWRASYALLERGASSEGVFGQLVCKGYWKIRTAHLWWMN